MKVQHTSECRMSGTKRKHKLFIHSYMFFFRKNFQGVGGHRLELKEIKLILMYFAACPSLAYESALESPKTMSDEELEQIVNVWTRKPRRIAV